MKDEPIVVLDACSLIAFFNDERGAEIVSKILQEVNRIEISAINLLEIAYDAVRRTGDSASATKIIEIVSALPVHICWDLDAALIKSASSFKARFRISMADAVALALAEKLSAPLVTCDHHEFDPIENSGQARFLWIR